MGGEKGKNIAGMKKSPSLLMSVSWYIGGTDVTNRWNYGASLGLIKKSRKART